MLRPSRMLALLAALFLIGVSFHAGAQTVSCTGIAQWNSSTIYNPGNRFVFESRLYEAVVQIWNTSPNHCPSCNWYRVLGNCGTVGGGAPTAQITSPVNGASFAAPANFTITATASDVGGTITKVDFFRGTTLLGTDTTAPYSFSVSNAAQGGYSLTAVATDNSGATGTSAVVNVSVNPVGGSPPTAQITSPANNASFTAPANFTIAANASDPGGIVTKVDFFRGTTLLGTDTTTPYSINVSNLAQGPYSLTAVATDNNGATGTSAAVNIMVNAPGGGDQCSSPTYIAGTTYTNGQLVRNVGQVYRCNVAGWCSSTAAWAYAPGTGAHWQDAWTQLGACTGGGTPPTVSITSPSNGASFACGAPVTISAGASDTDGFVTRVDFFDSGVLMGTDTTAPYSTSWVGNSAGAHALTARAVDDRGNGTTSSAVSVTIGACSNSGLPARILVGYWHNFDNGSGFIKLRDVSTAWDIVNISFGEPVAGSTSRIGFTPDLATSAAEIQSDVQILHARGKKVLLSVGGANGHVELRNATERQEFVDSVTAIIRQYGLDGLDVDFEGQSVHVDAGDTNFASPTTPVIVNLISALRQIRTNIGPNFVLTMAPETFFVQVGYQFYGGRTGAYLPVIHGVRDILTLLHVQDYNSGSVMALDNQLYAMGNADFHVAMTEMLMRGFPVANTGHTFPGLRPNQIAIGLPANVNAGNGWTPVPEVQRALNYLILGQPFGGRYVLRNPAGYRSMRGLMSWSINWDRFAGFDFSSNHRQYLNALPAP